MTDALTVETASGALRGKSEDGVRRWLGIPYARAERFAAPQPAAKWEGVRDATRFGKKCPQMFGNRAKRAFVDGDFGEDCLDLNVYVPEGGEDVGGKPVYVWIHGGAFTVGTANSYDGSWMARLGDVVVVTINYRVGVLGFVNFGEALGLPAIPSNLGLRDQIAALEWVRDNIAAFGGDPARVTIGGESAGSMSVSLLMHSERARPLFHGAIMQSGAVSLIQSREASRARGRRYAEILGIDQAGHEKLKSIDLRALFEAQAQIAKENPGATPAGPWYDDDLLPASLDDTVEAKSAAVPLIAGHCGEEITLFELLPGGNILPCEWDELEALLEAYLGRDQAKSVLAQYPKDKKGRRALASDLAFAMPTRNFAERHAGHSPAWVYRFEYSHPIAGPTHGLDLTLTWPMKGFRAAFARGGRMRGRRAALGERMVAHYAHFVRHGKPGPDWPRYAPEDRKVMVFDITDGIEHEPHRERFAAWDGRDIPARLPKKPAEAVEEAL